MKRPNILWIMTDQHRADCLGCMGHPLLKTPNLDRIAARGVVFENAFCQSPVCMSSRASIFTGRYPEAIRVRGMGILPPTETTFPEVLQRNGYQTALFGKLHLTPELYTREVLKSETPIIDWRKFAAAAHLPPLVDSDPAKENYGFQTHVGCNDACQQPFREWLAERAPELLNAAPTRVTDAPADLWISPYPSAHHQTTFIAESAAEHIRAQSGHSPWFTFCSFVAPHHPFEAPADQLARYPLSAIPLPEQKGEINPALIPEPARAAIGESDTLSEDAQRRIVQHYLASISLIDDGIGKILSVLEERGELDHTLIVFNADHGEFIGNHGLLRKPSLHFDETLRVPLLLSAPGRISPGRRISGLVELLDLHPTLLRLLDLEINPGVQGIDWSEALCNDQEIGREDIYADMYQLPRGPLFSGGPYTAVLTLRTKEWKLNLYPLAGLEYGQLFHLATDPDEAVNLYADPACREQREKLLFRLLSRQHRNVDPLPPWLSQW